MILITGGSGFLGRAVANALPEAKSLSSSDLDFTNGQQVEAAIAEWKPEVVIHLAARVGGITANIANKSDFIVDNLRIDANLIASLRHHPPKHLVSMLSTCMYPDRLDDACYPMTEEMIEDGPPPITNDSYAAAKRALWHSTIALNEQYGVPYTAVVPANLYGPGDHFGEEASHFLAASIDRIEKARLSSATEVPFFGTGSALRQYVLSEDMAKLVALLANSAPLNTTVNVAPKESKSIRDLALMIAEIAGYDGRIHFTGEGPDGQIRKDVSSDRLLSLIPMWREIETPLREGIGTTIDWYRTNVASC